MSDHRVEIVPVVLEPHGNADALSIVRVFDGYTCCVRTADWQGISQAAFIPPDSVVPDTVEYAFLNGHRRIRAKKLRGVQSYGLLVPAPDGYKIGQDVADVLGIVHYEPALKMANGDEEAPPPIPGEKYDIENYLKYKSIIPEGTEVTITEKIHGTNARFTYQAGRMWCGSRSMYRKDSGDCVYWRALRENQWIEEFCQDHEGAVLYGEIFGWIQSLRYGHSQGGIEFLAFDVYYGGRFIDWPDTAGIRPGLRVPELYRGPLQHDRVMTLATGTSTLASHMREGVVIKPVTERWNDRVGRVILKAVSPEYLEKGD